MAEVDWDARSEAAGSVFMKAAERAPLKTDLGFCAYGDAPVGGGMPIFHWFATKEDMLKALRGHALFVFPPHSGMDVDTAQLALERATADPADLETLQRNLNEHLRGALQFTWMGSFKDLCEGDHPTAQDVRAAFRGTSRTSRTGRASLPPVTRLPL
jgi:hypothetical protein